MNRRAPRKSPRAAGQKPAAERVFDVAADLFYRQGIRAVGVDEIVKRAGVAKISLYRSFSSKDDLIVAYLERRHAAFWRQMDEDFFARQADPRAQLRAVMSYLADRTTQPGYRGCPFINFCAEFPDPSHPGHAIARANKREWRSRLTRVAQALGVPRPEQLGDALLLLVEGAYAISQTSGGVDGPAHAIVWAADALVENQLNANRR